MEVSQQYGDEVRFIGMPGLAGLDSVLEFVEETGTDGIEHIHDPDGALWNQFGVLQQRTYVLIDDDGTMRTTGYGSLEQDVLDLIAG